MRAFTILLLLLNIYIQAQAQSIYFPPASGNSWDTISPSSIGWCQPSIDSLYSFLEKTNTKAFIVLKNGRIVLEKYFGSFTQDSVYYWASAGKSLIGMLTGIAQEKKLVHIDSSVSKYIGNGWTIAPPEKEKAITLRHLLCMTSGLDDTPPQPCDNENPTPECLQYLTDTGQRWAYHTGAYQKIATALSAATGTGITQLTNSYIGNKTGMTGLWISGVYYSRARSMARFGLLALNKGIWNTDTLLRDTGYFNSMINTSQPYNKAYGYLWWLNGKSNFMAPGLQFVFNGSLVPKAPADMYAAMGKNDQKIYVVPSQQLVVIRMGESAYGIAAAFSPFDDLLWGKIDSLDYKCQYQFSGNGNWTEATNWQNNIIPPSTLDKDAEIIINPAAGGACILNKAQQLLPGTKLTLQAGASLKIEGNLIMQ
jgi:CubicO group peptidase (beta-lactamase class C family)